MLLHTCDGVEFGDVNEEVLTGGPCFALQQGGRNSPWLPCLRGSLIGAWAVGGGVSTKQFKLNSHDHNNINN